MDRLIHTHTQADRHERPLKVATRVKTAKRKIKEKPPPQPPSLRCVNNLLVAVKKTKARV